LPGGLDGVEQPSFVLGGVGRASGVVGREFGGRTVFGGMDDDAGAGEVVVDDIDDAGVCGKVQA
jgi:hypothetical protein